MIDINVKELGAKGDGVTDDYLAIQNAINKASIDEKAVYIPSGTYIISKTLLLNDKTQIIGDGPFLTIIKLKNNVDIGIKCQLNKDVTKGISIKDLQIQGDFSNQSITQTAIYLENYHYLSIVENIRIENVTKGIYITNSWYAQIKDISIMNVIEYGIEIYQKSMSEQVNALPLINIQQDGGKTAIYAHSADGAIGRGLYISKSTFENTKKTAIIIEHMGNTSIRDCYFENNYLDTSDILIWKTPTEIKIVNDKWASQATIDNITIAQGGSFITEQSCNIYIGGETSVSLSNIEISYYNQAIKNFKCGIYSDTTYPITTQSIHMTNGIELIKKGPYTIAGNSLSNTVDISTSCENLIRNSNFRFGTGFWDVAKNWLWNVENSNDNIINMSINQANLTSEVWSTLSQKIINPGTSEFMQCGIDIMTIDKDSFKGNNVILDISGYKIDGSKEYIYSTYITPLINNQWISNLIVFKVPSYIKIIKYSIILNQNGSIKIRKPYLNLGYVRPIYSCSSNASKVIPTIKSNVMIGEVCLSDNLASNKPVGWIFCSDNTWRSFGNIN